MNNVMQKAQAMIFSHYTQMSKKDLKSIPSVWYTPQNEILMVNNLYTWINTECKVVNNQNVSNAFNHFYEYLYFLCDMENEYNVDNKLPNADVAFDLTFLKSKANNDNYDSSFGTLNDIKNDDEPYHVIFSNKNLNNHTYYLEITNNNDMQVMVHQITVSDFMAYAKTYIKALIKYNNHLKSII